MFAVIYHFNVKRGQEVLFEASWAALTDLIYCHENSLGSRLHKSKEGKYIAYALWPDQETWKNSGELLPPEAKEWRTKLRSSCEQVLTLHEMEVIDDKLMNKQYQS
jgi:heme-degrading monooxygenase HmoA